MKLQKDPVMVNQQQLEFFINDTCKISFEFFIDKETKTLKWRDLMGPEKRVFFKNMSLADHLPNLISHSKG